MALAPAFVHEPDPWNAQAIDPYRACALCDHGHLDYTGARCCRHPSATYGGRPVPVKQTRSRTGACGDGHLMDAPFLRG